MKLETITNEVIEDCLNRCPFPIIGNLITSFAKLSSKEMDRYLKYLHSPFEAYWEDYIHQAIKTSEIYNQLEHAFKLLGGSHDHLIHVIEPINEIIENKYFFLAEEHERLLDKTHNSKDLQERENKIASFHLSHAA